MILNLRGTSGAGKSTIVKAVMERYPDRIPVSVTEMRETYGVTLETKESRKRPFGYILRRDDRSPLWVPGHYEIACGGCDTIPKVDDVYASLRYFREHGYNVLFEGIMVQDDVKRAIDLSRQMAPEPFVVYVLTTPLDVCLAGVQARRDERGETKPLDPKNTRSRAERVIRNASRLRDAGVTVKKLSREDALQDILEALSL